jgi:hypothetical protein
MTVAEIKALPKGTELINRRPSENDPYGGDVVVLTREQLVKLLKRFNRKPRIKPKDHVVINSPCLCNEYPAGCTVDSIWKTGHCPLHNCSLLAESLGVSLSHVHLDASYITWDSRHHKTVPSKT